jgi:flagellar M-ring protein FliF
VVAAPASYFGLSKAELLRAGEPVALAIVGLLVMLLVVRPLIGRILESTSSGSRNALTGPEAQRLLTGPPGSAVSTVAGVQSGVPAMAMAVPNGSPDSVDQMIDISQVEGRVRASSIKKIGEIVEKHPEEAVAIVRSWMYQNA